MISNMFIEVINNNNIFIHEILKYILIREKYTTVKYILNLLCTSNKLKIICEDNELWKYTLLNVFKVDYKINENSKHIHKRCFHTCGGKCWVDSMLYSLEKPEQLDFKNKLIEDTNTYYITMYGTYPPANFHHINTYRYRRALWEVLRQYWDKLNIKCNNIMHYDLTTLDSSIKYTKKNYSNYKKIVFNKLLSEMKPNKIRKITVEERKYNALLKQLEIQKSKLNSLNELKELNDNREILETYIKSNTKTKTKKK